MYLSHTHRLQMTQQTEATSVDRRTVLRSAGVVAAAGLVAGCSGGSTGDGSSGGDGEGGSDGSSGDSGGDGSSGGSSGGGGVPSEVEEYLSDANNYSEVTDETESSSVTVDVGAGDAGLAFGPAAVRLSTGTTVTWEWTGQGGSHNVIAEDGTFDSGELQASGTYEYTFEESGVYNYYCQPHKMSGMKGAIIVE
jgi:halocyanin-like protein